MAVIGSLSVKLGLVTVEWDQATAKAKKQAKDLQKAFNDLTGNVKTLAEHFKSLGGAFSFGAIGLGALVQQTIEFSGQIKDLAKGFDISVAKVLQFRDAIQTSGGSADGASKMLSTLFSKIEDAQGGNEAAIAQFEQLGISFRELSNLSPEQAINRIFTALSDQSLSTYERVKKVKEMLGKQGIGVAVDEVAAKLKMSVAEYKKSEDSIKKLGEVSDNLKTSLDNLKLAFASVLSPFTGDGLIKVETFKAAMFALGSAFLVGQLFALYKVLMLVRGAIAANAAIGVSLTALIPGKGMAMAVAAGATYLAAAKLFEVDDKEKPFSSTSSGRIRRPGTTPEYMDGELTIEERLQANRRELAAAQAKVDLAKKLTGIEHQQSLAKLESLSGDKMKADLRLVDLQAATQIATIENARAQALTKENLSEDQRRLINADFNQQIFRASQKAKDDKEFIGAQENKDINLQIKQLQLIKDMFAMEMAASELKLKSIGMDKLVSELATAELQTRTEIARINGQERIALEKANLTEKERDVIRGQAYIDRSNADTRYLDTRKLIQRTYDDEVATIQRLRQAQDQEFASKVKMQVLDQNRFMMRESEARIVEEQIQSERKIADYRRQQNEAQIRMGAGDMYDQEKRRIDDLIAAEGILSDARQKAIQDEETRRRSFSEGFKSAARQFAEDAENYGRLGSDMFSAAIGNMNSAIDNFVRTGKLNFKDFAKSVIMDIMAMSLKFRAMQVVMFGLRSMGFGGFGGSAPPLVGSFPAVPAMAAAGGEIDGPTIVGENGPELFIPQRRGTVIPNMQASSYGQRQAQTVINGPYIASMSAIDTQSAIQFLSKNKMAIWSANQSAQRSVPASR